MATSMESPDESAGDRERSILIVAEHTLTGALVESLVEVAGMRPLSPKPGERIVDAVARVHPEVVLLDFDHPASNDDSVYERAQAEGAQLLLFSSGGDRRALVREGERRGVSTCRLPLPHREFTALVTRLVAERGDAPPGRSGP